MSMMLEVLREFGGISFIFDLKEGEMFLGAIGDLRGGKKFEIGWMMGLKIKNMGRRLFCPRKRVSMLGINWKS
ncbi:TPA: hypothetical protein ACUNF5_003239 [Burkholderia orbicola]